MVLFFTSTSTSTPTSIYMGRDKVENEDLIKYGTDRDVWFHVDKLSSAHVYVRLPDSEEEEQGSSSYGWENMPEGLVRDCAQLTKANSIEGNKKNNITIIYTPWSNLKKTGDMAVGQVGFHNDRKVKRVLVPARDNLIVNRLSKTKREVEVDHEAERQARLRKEGARKKAEVVEQQRAAAAQKKVWAEQKKAQTFESLFSDEAFEERRRQEEEDGDDFM